MSHADRISELEQKLAYVPVQIGGYSTAPFGFYQTADDGNGYPQPQDKANVYFALKSVPGPFLGSGSPYVTSGGPLSGMVVTSGTFSGTILSGGLQPLTVNNSGVGWYFMCPSQAYIPEGSNMVLIKDGWQLFTDENGPAVYLGTVAGTTMNVTSLNGQPVSFSQTVVNNIGGSGSAIATGTVANGNPTVIWAQTTG